MDNVARKKFKRRLRIRTLFFLALTLSCNTFAWFVYTSKVENSITAKVREWKVTFDVNGSNVTQNIALEVDSLFPGMEDAEQVLSISNSGEAKASITYEIVEASVLGEDLLALGLTDEEVITKLRTDYPFTIDFNASSGEVISHTYETVRISVYWPYESGDDEADTLWGNLAYEYHHSNPTSPSIKLVVKITAFQAPEHEENLAEEPIEDNS